MLDDIERVTGLQRKTIIRRMNGLFVHKVWTRQRGRIYGTEVDDALRVIAESEDYITEERLAPNLKWMTEHLVTHGELQVPAR